MYYSLFRLFSIDEGYTLTYLGYDYLAIKVLLQRKSLKTIRSQMGVGKESDVYFAVDEQDNPLILKLTQYFLAAMMWIIVWENSRSELFIRKGTI